MTIIIDGYNVLKQFFSGYIDKQVRHTFAIEMATYARQKKHTIIIVYDGDYDYSDIFEKTKRVKIVYSGSDITADDAIKDLIDRYALHDILLVTDDSTLNQYASARNVVSIGSRDFYNFVQKTLANKNQKAKHSTLIKTVQESNPELDLLMGLASNRIDIKEEDNRVNDLSAKGKTTSKIDRLLLRKLEKL